MVYRQAQRQHKKGAWDEARQLYEQVIDADFDETLSAAAKGALHLVSEQKKPPGSLGYWAIALVVLTPVVTTSVGFLPAGMQNIFGGVIISLLGIAGVAGLLCAIIALGFQAGRANKICGAVALAGFAIFACMIDGQDNTKLERVVIMEGLSFANAAKTGVSEYYFETGEMPASNAEARVFEPLDIDSHNVRSVTITDGGIITIEYQAENFAGQSIIYRPLLDTAGSVLWDCYDGTVAHEVRPSNCRTRLEGKAISNIQD
jgi:type IV pilus assembly protein PilA